MQERSVRSGPGRAVDQDCPARTFRNRWRVTGDPLTGAAQLRAGPGRPRGNGPWWWRVSPNGPQPLSSPGSAEIAGPYLNPADYGGCTISKGVARRRKG